jgi:AAA domain
MLTAVSTFWSRLFLPRQQTPVAEKSAEFTSPLKAIGLNEFLRLEIPAREMLLDPILPERSLAMLYAPRGLGKSWLALSIGLAVASGSPLLRWSAPRRRRVLYVDGEMPLVALQERLLSIAASAGSIANDGFRLLAADYIESGIDLSSEKGQQSVEVLLPETDFLILDNLSTVCGGGENASDSWLPMQQWLLRLRRKGLAVLLVHHAGTNGRQCGTSRREDALDAVIALRRPENYSPDQGCRCEIHFEKLRNRVDPAAAVPFEAHLETVLSGGQERVQWRDRELVPPVLKQAAELFENGLTVREVAAALKISKSEAGRLRLRSLQHADKIVRSGCRLDASKSCPKSQKSLNRILGQPFSELHSDVGRLLPVLTRSQCFGGL